MMEPTRMRATRHKRNAVFQGWDCALPAGPYDPMPRKRDPRTRWCGLLGADCEKGRSCEFKTMKSRAATCLHAMRFQVSNCRKCKLAGECVEGKARKLWTCWKRESMGG